MDNSKLFPDDLGSEYQSKEQYSIGEGFWIVNQNGNLKILEVKPEEEVIINLRNDQCNS
jgi:hypothetical protein